MKKKFAVQALFLLIVVSLMGYFVFSGPIGSLTASFPTNGTNASSATVVFNCTYVLGNGSVSTNLTNLSLFINSTGTNGLFLVNQTNYSSLDAYNNTPYNFTVLNVPEGKLEWYCESNNGSASNNRNVTLNTTLWVDYTSPNTITLQNPAEAINYSNGTSLSIAINFNWTAVDNVATWLNCNVTLDGVVNNTAYLMSTNGTTDNLTLDNIANGKHQINVTCYDWAFNSNTTETRNFSVFTKVPTVTLNAPANTYNSSNSRVEFNWTAESYSFATALTCNLTVDNVTNVSNIAVTNGTLQSQTVSGLSLGTHLWNVTCWDWFGLTNGSVQSNYSRHVGPIVIIDFPGNLTWNVSSLNVNLNVTSTEKSTIFYDLDNAGNITICTFCTSGNTNMSVFNYGNHTVKVYANDSSGNLNVTTRVFTLNLDTDGNGTLDSDALSTDDDADGIIDTNDTVTGNSSNINTNVFNLTALINGSYSAITFNGTFQQLQINITNHSGVALVTLTHNFTNMTKLILGNVTVQIESASDTYGKILVRNLPPSSGTNKTVYVNKLNSTHRWVCVKDVEVGVNTSLTPKCNGANEVLVDCTNGSANGNIRCSEVGGRLKVSGLSYSVVESKCRENWTIGAWANCQIGGTQTRTVTDNNGCNTILMKAATSRGCTYGSASGSTTSTGSSSTSTSTDIVASKISYIVGTLSSGSLQKIVLADGDKVGVTQLEIKVKTVLTGVKIVLEKLKGAPAYNVVAENAKGVIYSYLKFNNVNLPDSEIEEAKIKFVVPRTWLDENGLSSGDVLLARYADDEWTDLETTVIKSEATQVTYEASTPGFSYFAVRADTKSAADEIVSGDVTNAESAEASAEEILANEEAMKEKASKKSLVWLLITLLLVGAAIVVSLVFYFKRKRESMSLKVSKAVKSSKRKR